MASAALLLLGLAAILGTSSISAQAQNTSAPMRLWEGDAPGAHGATPADIPTITLFKPEKPNGSAVVVCPGGGYGGLADHEGKPIAEWLNSLGVTAFVLRYRLGSAGYHHPVEIGDAQRAIRTVRAKAADWAVDPHRIGIIGFSAGGHLASSTVTHFDDGNPASADPVERVSCRPDLGILCYPVITMTDPFTHAGSRANLLGPNPPQALIDLMSSEKQVTAKTPPCFLMQTNDDTVVPMENALMFALACHKAGVPCELHMYEHGPHGIGLGGNDPIWSTWPKLCAAWMEKRGFFKKQ
jgi:acetyl esterase/lipase